LSFAADTKAIAPQQAASKAKPVAKPAAKIKLVDINSASSEELKKLPGIGDAEAAKIIASRPYGSKAWLLGHKILPEDKYPGIKDLIIAKQPNKDAAKNAAPYSKKKP
jgi:competence protein ComEA